MQPEMTNADRAAKARSALDAYGQLSGQTGYDYGDPEFAEEIVSDLIADLLHVADAAGLDPEDVLEGAQHQYECEVREDAAS